MTGRPTLRTDAVIEELLSRLEVGTPLAQICREAHMPAVRTVMDWIAGDADLSARVACAREMGGDAIASDALAIADETSSDTRTLANGQDVPDSEWISRSRLRVETRLKLLACWHPKRYGTKVGLTDGDGAPLQLGVAVSFVVPAKPDDN